MHRTTHQPPRSEVLALDPAVLTAELMGREMTTMRLGDMNTLIVKI